MKKKPLVKHSEMNVPSPAEAKEESNIVDTNGEEIQDFDQRRDSKVNEAEKTDAFQLLHDSDKTASEIIDILVLKKIAKYLKPIKCDVCNYKGVPDDDGRCPICGAVEGIKPDPTSGTPERDVFDRNQMNEQFFEGLESAIADTSEWTP